MFDFWKRRQFRDVVTRQLALFESDHGDLVVRARAERAAYDRTSAPDDALKHYAVHDDLSDDVETLLYEMCERFASTVDPDRAHLYISEFDHQARARYRDLIPRLRFPGMGRDDDEELPPLGPLER